MTPAAVHPLLMEILRGSAPATVLPLAPEDRGWAAIVEDASAHGLAPLLYRWLKDARLDRRVPEALLRRLEGQAFGQAARNAMLARKLEGVLRAFEEQGIACAPLRGLELAERLYGDIGARPLGDLDLLVRKGNLPGVAAILRGLGYREMDRRAGFAEAFSYTLKFFKDRHCWIVIEPHWTLTYPPFQDRIDMDGVWKRCVRGRAVGVETWLLAKEDLLFHLGLHLVHRAGTAPLLWWHELDRLVRQSREALDWARFLSVARGARLEFLLSRALGEVKALFATPIPDRVLALLAVQRPRSVEDRLARLLAGASSVDGKESLAVLFTLTGLRPRLRYAFAILFPSAEFMRLQYGLTRRNQLVLAYVRRFCRFCWEGLKGVVQVLFR
jgi:hypothetical protein